MTDKPQNEQRALPDYEGVRQFVERVISVRTRLRRHFREHARRKARAEAIATVTRVLKQARDSNAENVRRVLNAGLYLLLIDQELADFSDDLGNAIGDRRRRFVAKHLALLLFEASEDFPQLLGKRFREALAMLSPPAETMKRLNEIASDFNAVWRENREFLGEIRNAVTAHREHDALAYLEILEGIRPLEVMERGVRLSVPLRGLIAVLREILETSVTPMTIAKDILRGMDSRQPP